MAKIVGWRLDYGQGVYRNSVRIENRDVAMNLKDEYEQAGYWAVLTPIVKTVQPKRSI